MWSICPASGTGQASSPALAQPLPGKEAHALWVGVGAGEELLGAVHPQVGKAPPVACSGEQAL